MNTALSKMSQGSSGKIVSISCSNELKQRLSSLGFTRGAKVTVSHSTLLNDPRTYTIRGSEVCLRNREADAILVEFE